MVGFSPKLLGVVAVLLVAVSCSPEEMPMTTQVETITTAEPEPGTVTSLNDEVDFDSFVEESFSAILRRDPEAATALGIGKSLGISEARLTDLSVGFAADTNQILIQILTQLEQFDSLSADQELTRDTFAWYLEREMDAYRFRLHDWPVHFLVTSYNQGLYALFAEIHPIETTDDVDNYLSRLEQARAQVGQVIANMSSARDEGILPPAYVIDVTISQLRSQLGSGNPRQTEIFQSFAERLARLTLEGATASAYLDRAEVAIANSFTAGWNDLIEFLEDVRPEAGGDISLGRLPNGSEFYQSLLTLHTSTDLDPGSIHQMGRDQIDRIAEEMTELSTEIGQPGAAIGELRRLFANEAGFVQSPDVVSTYQSDIDDAYDAFAPYFTLTPSSEIAVVNDPGPVAFYIGPAADGSRPGSFHAGTGGGRVPRYTMRSLAYHEAVPGHHFQIALAQELDLPLPQQHFTVTAHVEGWALYAERLASDIGLYKGDPASDFGRLDFELLRAARLVVDTGIHDLGWSRDQAIAEMTEIMDGTEYNLEVDRYAVYPAQATAYMIGMQAILDLRDRMGVDMTDPDSLADFHDLIIGHGNVPLPLLEALTD